jgi:GDPmannose 4,6-dehydratase
MAMKLSILSTTLALLFFSHSLLYPKRAIIFGITGQDGAYLSEFLLTKGYEVHGIIRNASVSNTNRIDHLVKNPLYKNTLFLHCGDLSDSHTIATLIKEIMPDEIYNLAAQSNVKLSFEIPEYTANIDALGTLRILEAIRTINPHIRFYQASTSEMFGKAQESPQKEITPFYPRSPYAVSKLFAYWITVNYREAYGIFACNGILFNHESPLRGEAFVTRKISMAAAQTALGIPTILCLGNIDTKRDWGYAKDYVEAMWLMLQQEHPDDYVISMEENHSVREFIEKAFQEIGITLAWQGTGLDEVGIDANTGTVLVKIDPRYFRPSEVDALLGDATKAHAQLGWKPTTSFDHLVKLMVHADVALLHHTIQKNSSSLLT